MFFLAIVTLRQTNKKFNPPPQKKRKFYTIPLCVISLNKTTCKEKKIDFPSLLNACLCMTMHVKYYKHPHITAYTTSTYIY